MKGTITSKRTNSLVMELRPDGKHELTEEEWKTYYETMTAFNRNQEILQKALNRTPQIDAGKA